jgi:DNA-directed RNA polymerase subunit beta'
VKSIVETRDRTKNPGIEIRDKNDKVLKTYNLPVGSHLRDEVLLKAGEILQNSNIIGNCMISPVVWLLIELFEARNLQTCRCF